MKGEVLALKETINTMVDQLNAFASEVTRVAREVGSEGELGGQAVVPGVAGTWKDLTDNVNSMATNLTTQVRGIARVVTSVATGDLKRKLAVEAKGEIAALADTINGMTDTLAVFADQVTAVAREVGIEGKLGGQARVPGAAGIWRDLTDNVNQSRGQPHDPGARDRRRRDRRDQGRPHAVDLGRGSGRGRFAQGQHQSMIKNLRDTTRKNMDQDWLKTNLAKFTRTLQGQRDLLAISKLILCELAPLVSAQHGVFFMHETKPEGEPVLKLLRATPTEGRRSPRRV